MNTAAIETSRALIAIMEENERSEAVVSPGLYPNMPMARYLKIDAASNSQLAWLKRSAAHLKAYRETPPTFVDPDSIGSASHALVLEGPDAFNTRYACAPPDADHKGRKPWLEFAASLPAGVVPMKASDHATVCAMAERVFDHPAARLALENATVREVSMVWDDAETGVRIKGRPDALNPSIAAIVDYKSTKNASRRAFERSIFDYSYHMQGSLYQDGANVLTGDGFQHHVIIAQEKEPPYAVAVYRIQDAALTAGRDEYRKLLGTYRECVERDEWPGYGTKFEEITLPPWAWKEVEQDLYQ